MPKRLTKAKEGDWKSFRRVARHYERALIRIYQATACSADVLRRFAKEAVYGKPKQS